MIVGPSRFRSARPAPTPVGWLLLLILAATMGVIFAAAARFAWSV